MDKKVIVVLAVVIIVGAAAYMVTIRQDPGVRQEVEPHPFPALQVEPPQDPQERRTWQSPVKRDLDQIEIISKDDRIVLKRVKEGDAQNDVGEWEMVEPIQYKGNVGKIRQLINRVESLEFWEVITDRKEDFSDYRVGDKSGVRARLLAGDRVLADMIIGNTVSAKIGDRAQQYTAVRKHGADAVWKVMGSLTNVFDTSANAWRDTVIISERQDLIAGLVIKDGDGEYLAALRDSDAAESKDKRTNWRLVSSSPEIDELDRNDIARTATSIARLRTRDFADDKSADGVGLTEPERRIFAAFIREPEVRIIGEEPESEPKGEAEGETEAAESEPEKPQTAEPVKTLTGIPEFDALAANPDYAVYEILLGKEEEDTKTRYIKLAGNPQIFAVAATTVTNLEKKISEFRDKTIFKLDPSEIVRIEVQHPDGKTVLAKAPAPKEEKKEDTTDQPPDETPEEKEDPPAKPAEPQMVWKALEPKGLELDSGGVDRLIKLLEDRFNARAFSDTTDTKITGLAKPEGRVLLTLKGQRRPVELLIGNEHEKRQYYVQVRGRPDVYIIGSYPLTQLYKAPENWKKRQPPPPGAGPPGMPPGMMQQPIRR